jgi:hypothetical protein
MSVGSTAVLLLKQRLLLLRQVDATWHLRIYKDYPGEIGETEDVKFTIAYGDGPHGERRYQPYQRLASAIGNEKDEYKIMALAFERALAQKNLPAKMRAFLGVLTQLHRDLSCIEIAESDHETVGEWEKLLFCAGFDWPKDA